MFLFSGSLAKKRDFTAEVEHRNRLKVRTAIAGVSSRSRDGNAGSRNRERYSELGSVDPGSRNAAHSRPASASLVCLLI